MTSGWCPLTEPARADVTPWRQIIWRRLLDTAAAACKAEPDELAEQDAAEALGMIAPALVRDQEPRAAAAARLRAEVWQATEHTMAVDLRVERVDRCTDAIAAHCALRQDHACPRNIRYAQRQKRLQQAREATSRGVPADLARRVALGELPQTESLRAASRFVDGKWGGRHVLLFSNDEGGEGTQAAAWAMYHLSTGRFVPMARLRFARREDQLVQDVLASSVLALDGVADIPKPARELLETVIESICRGRGKLVLTTPQQSRDFLAELPKKVQGLIKKHGEVVPVVPEQPDLVR